MKRDSNTDNETPIKTTFSNVLHCLETYLSLMRQVVNDAVFSSLQNAEKELYRVRNQSHGSVVNKVKNSWQACHKFEPRTAEDPPCRGSRHPLSTAL
ncbi:hypothetical protein TNCV_756991 [Trichonephila clavipes]|nr:hypothetical protein TNCV_756991 [Trichonephila clavipes]